MSKIDLSKAKIGDKFRTKNGLILTYCKRTYVDSDFHVLTHNDGSIDVFYKNGNYLKRSACGLDLAEQVFDDEKDRAITDKIIKDVEKVVNGVLKAMPLIESTTIANLSREPLPENNEDDDELQRRQEVVELAEKLVTNELFAVTNHLHDMRELGAAINLDSPTEYAFLIAEEFVNNKSKYLKNGKL